MFSCSQKWAKSVQLKSSALTKKRDIEDHINLIDMDKDKYKIPPASFEAVVKMPASEFHKTCREMNTIADYVEIQCVNNKLIFKCKGDEGGRTVEYEDSSQNEDSDNDDTGIVRIKHSDDDNEKKLKIVKEIYDLKNITLFNKFTNLCDDIQIFMKSKYPLVVRYSVANLGHILVVFTPVRQDNSKFNDEKELYNDKDDVEYLDD